MQNISLLPQSTRLLQLSFSVVKVRGLGKAQAPCFGLNPLLQFEPHLLNAWPGLL